LGQVSDSVSTFRNISGAATSTNHGSGPQSWIQGRPSIQMALERADRFLRAVALTNGKRGPGTLSVEEPTGGGETFLDSLDCPADTIPDIFLLGHGISGQFILGDSCTLLYVRTCTRGDTAVSDTVVICANICDDTCASSICFRWTDPVLHDTLVRHRVITCEEETSRYLRLRIDEQTTGCVSAQLREFERRYRQTCLDAVDDQFTIRYRLGYYHFTLFYYDRAGNLIKTVPPRGVQLSSADRMEHPDHRYQTAYHYNSLGQLISKVTPEGGSHYYYDDKGQLRFSQSGRQGLATPPRYSYTKYDNLGRVVETGEALIPTLGGLWVDDFRTHVNDPAYPMMGQTQRVWTSYTTATGNFYLHDAGDPGRKQRYLRNRVSSRRTEDGVSTVYSYDPHGNVEWVAQYLPGLGGNFVGYDYDLISNKVLRVSYDETWGDAHYQRYHYDEDQRLIRVESSRDGEIWDRDASYSYYNYGPLDRIALGEDSLQGLDYVYTIQGWLKGMNHPVLALEPSYDPGRDGVGSSSRYAPDVFGMILGYYAGDFARNSGSQQSRYNSATVGTSTVQPYQLSGGDLYNGNISSWSVRTLATSAPSYGAVGTPVTPTYNVMTGYVYRYDILNRLKQGSFRVHNMVKASLGTPQWLTLGSGDYNEDLTYDANGNIVTLNRNGYLPLGGGATSLMDQLSYNYMDTTGTPGASNELLLVNDAVAPSSAYIEDLEDQTAFGQNYVYDADGNLIQDRQDGTQIRWSAYGKVIRVRKASASVSQVLEFVYDAAGERVMKRLYDYQEPDSSRVTYYVRDANEQVLAVYEQALHWGLPGSPTCGPVVPGSIGDVDVDGVPESPTACDNCGGTGMPPTIPMPNPWQEDYDRDGIGDACDQCPMFSNPGGLPCQPPYYGIPGPPIPGPWFGLGVYLKEEHIYGSGGQGRFSMWKPNVLRDTTVATGTVYVRRLTKKEYELKDHLGNVRVVISDLKLGNGNKPFMTEMRAYNNYYSYGMMQPGRSWQSRGYRYGYNGKESDGEWKEVAGSPGSGFGNVYDYGARMYDPRLGRWMSKDPEASKYPSVSSFLYVNDSPVSAIDSKGEDVFLLSENPVVYLAYQVLLKTPNGRKLIESYESGVRSKQHDLYLQSQPIRRTFWQMFYTTAPVGATIDDANKVYKNTSYDLVDESGQVHVQGLPQDNFVSIFEGLDVSQSMGKVIGLINFDDDEFSFDGLSDEKLLGLAEVIYHEIYAHVEQPAVAGIDLGADEEHSKYGNTFSFNLNGSQEGSPAAVIANQLKNIPKEEIKNMLETTRAQYEAKKTESSNSDE